MQQLSHVVAFNSQQCIEKTFKALIEEFELTSIKTQDEKRNVP
jgi:HEPN domain-containing protein